METIKRCNTAIPEGLWRKGRRAAGEEAISFSELMRKALELYLYTKYRHYFLKGERVTRTRNQRLESDNQA